MTDNEPRIDNKFNVNSAPIAAEGGEN